MNGVISGPQLSFITRINYILKYITIENIFFFFFVIIFYNILMSRRNIELSQTPRFLTAVHIKLNVH